MLANDRKGLKDLLTTLRKEKVTASVASEEEEAEEEAEEQDEAEEETGRRGRGRDGSRRRRNPTHRRLPGCGGGGQAVGQGSRGAGGAGRQARKEGIRQRVPDPHRGRSDQAHQAGWSATGEFYLVRAGNTRKGTGTFYTRPQLAVPTVHRTLEPLCYDQGRRGEGGDIRRLIPKTPEGNPRPQGLRPGLRQCLVPGGGAALPDRGPLQVALPPSEAGRSQPGEASHAALRPSKERQRG